MEYSRKFTGKVTCNQFPCRKNELSDEQTKNSLVKLDGKIRITENKQQQKQLKVIFAHMRSSLRAAHNMGIEQFYTQ